MSHPTTKKQQVNPSKAKHRGEKKPTKYGESQKWKILKKKARKNSTRTEWFISEPTEPDPVPEPTVLELEPIEPLFETLKEMKKLDKELDKMARLISEMLILKDVESDESDDEEYEPRYAQLNEPSPATFLIQLIDEICG